MYTSKGENYMKQTKLMYLTIGLMIVTTQSLFASTKSLVTFTNDQDKNKVTLSVNTDKNSYISSLNLNYSNRTNNVKISINQLKKGFVLLEKNNTNIIEIIAKNFDAEIGGKVILDYLYRFPYKREDLALTLSKNGGNWSLKDNQNNNIKFAKIISNKIFGEVVGIQKIELSAKPIK